MQEITKVKVIFSLALSWVFNVLGVLAIPIFILLGCNLIDYKTGLDAAPYRANQDDKRPVKSYKSIRGIQKKVNMYLLILVMWFVDIMIKTSLVEIVPGFKYPCIFAITTACWLIFNEIISILENMEDAGTPIPPFLMPIMKKIKKRVTINVEEGSGEDGKEDSIN